MSEWTDKRNRMVWVLRSLMARERRWLASNTGDEDGRENLQALEWAVQHLEGMPEFWIATESEEVAR